MTVRAKISTSDRDLIVVYTAKKEKPFGYDGLIKSHDGLSLARRFTEPYVPLAYHQLIVYSVSVEVNKLLHTKIRTTKTRF
jgi:hypothetical protein